MHYDVSIKDDLTKSGLYMALTGWYDALLASMRCKTAVQATSAGCEKWGWEAEDTMVELPENGDTVARYDIVFHRESEIWEPVNAVSLDEALAEIRSRIFWRGRAGRRVRLCNWDHFVFSRQQITASLTLFFP